MLPMNSIDETETKDSSGAAGSTPELRLPEELRDGAPIEVSEAALWILNDYLEAAGGSPRSKARLLPAHWRAVEVLHAVDMQVTNGGFHQLFTNTCGAYDAHIRKDVQWLGHAEYEAILGTALDRYATMDYQAQWDNLGVSWDFFADGYKLHDFEDLSTAYFATGPDLPTVIGQAILRQFDEYCSPEDSNPLNLQPKQPRVPFKHSFINRLNWSPFAAAIPLSYMGWSAYIRGFPVARTLWTCFMLVWFAMAVYDMRSGHKLLDWLYAPDDEEE